jgi:hypothetical protein
MDSALKADCNWKADWTNEDGLDLKDAIIEIPGRWT